MEALTPPRPWKNTRKRSLYVEQGYAGFIFYRKGKSPHVGGKGDVKTNEEEAEPEHKQAESTAVERELELTLAEGAESSSDEVTESTIEGKCFVEQLRKEMLSSGAVSSESKLQERLKEVAQVLSQTDTYTQFLKAAENKDQKLLDPRNEALVQSVAEMKEKMELCEWETKEWERIVEQKRAETEQAKRDTESNSAIDLSQLLPEDKAKLASHLTEEQREWLRRAGEREGDAGWLRRTEEELRRVSSKLNEELERMQRHSQRSREWCAAQALMLPDNSLSTETPRTLFRALKDTD